MTEPTWSSFCFTVACTATNFLNSLLLPDHSYFYQRQLFLIIIHWVDFSSIGFFNYFTVRRRIHFVSDMNIKIIIVLIYCETNGRVCFDFCSIYSIFIVVKSSEVSLLLFHCSQTYSFLANVIVRPPVVRLSVTFVHPTQAIEIFGSISTPFGAMAICWHPGKILRRSSQGNPSVGGVKQKRGNRM